MFKMATMVAKARVELKKSQVRYKKHFDRRMKPGKADVNEGAYIWIDIQDGM